MKPKPPPSWWPGSSAWRRSRGAHGPAATKGRIRISHGMADCHKSQLPISSEHIKVVVKAGGLTLEGFVEWQYQKNTAKRGAAAQGVRASSTNSVSSRKSSLPTSSRKIQSASSAWLRSTQSHYRPMPTAFEVILRAPSVRAWSARGGRAGRLVGPRIHQVEDRLS